MSSMRTDGLGGRLRTPAALGVCLTSLMTLATAAEARGVDGDGAGLPADYDVIVVGAGPGGIGAALQAAQMGMSVAMLEPTDHIGGQLITVTAMDDLATEREDGLDQCDETEPRGLFSKFIYRVRCRYGDHLINTCLSWGNQSRCFEAPTGKAILQMAPSRSARVVPAVARTT